MTRFRYLFDLASMAASPPPVVDGLAVGDFAVLVASIDATRAAAEKRG